MLLWSLEWSSLSRSSPARTPAPLLCSPLPRARRVVRRRFPSPPRVPLGWLWKSLLTISKLHTVMEAMSLIDTRYRVDTLVTAVIKLTAA